MRRTSVLTADQASAVAPGTQTNYGPLRSALGCRLSTLHADSRDSTLACYASTPPGHARVAPLTSEAHTAM
jgi:hypothetical protein